MEAEQYFIELQQNKEQTEHAWGTICQSIDRALKTDHIQELLELIPYIEQGEGYLAYQYIGETRRILCVLHIIQLEHIYEKKPFCIGCDDMHALMEKYMLVLFAFRRLLFRLSAESEEEAEGYLKTCEVSVFAAALILNDDLIHPDEKMIRAVKEIYGDVWDAEDHELFDSLLKMR